MTNHLLEDRLSPTSADVGQMSAVLNPGRAGLKVVQGSAWRYDINQSRFT